MFHDHFQHVEQSIYAYLLVDSTTAEILDGNQLAQNFYLEDGIYPPLDSIFQPMDHEVSVERMVKTLLKEEAAILDKVFSMKVGEGSFPCHIEVCRVSKTMLFLIVKENNTNRRSEMQELVELKDNPVFVLNQDEMLSISSANARFYHSVQLGKEAEQKGATFLGLLQEDRRAAFLKTLQLGLNRNGECDMDMELTFDGEYFHLFRFNAYRSILDDKLYGVLISVKKQSELMKKIEYDQQYFDIMQKFSKDLLFRIDVQNRLLIHRGDISRIVDLKPEIEDFPECFRELDAVHPEDLEGFIRFGYQILSGEEASFEPRYHINNGTYEKYRLQASPLYDENGNPIQVVGKCENIQRFVDIEAKANYDALTATLNKQSFRELVEDSFARAVERDRFALLFLDLDDFKKVNDTMGHTFGDFLLEATGKRILNCVRKQDRVGRVGGDEFVVFFQYAPSYQAVLERAEAILHSLRREFNYDGLTYKTRASVGISIFPEHGDSYEALYDRADKALYESKAKGKDVATIYTEEDHK